MYYYIARNTMPIWLKHAIFNLKIFVIAELNDDFFCKMLVQSMFNRSVHRS